MPLHIVEHPLVRHKLGVLRRADLPGKEFRDVANEIGRILAYEATRDLPTEEAVAEGWAGPVGIERIRGRRLTVVPILRAGFGMLEGVGGLIPEAKISVVGIFRDEETLEPQRYYTKLASGISERTALVVDPMLATGGSALATIDLLKEAGCRDVRGLFLVAAPEGVERVLSRHPEVRLYAAALDERLNAQGYIIPGLGDAGDRIFGTL